MQMSRRRSLQAAFAAALAATGTAACAKSDSSGALSSTRPRTQPSEQAHWRMPEESHPHELTYMAWPTRDIWGPDTAGVREDIAGIARAIAAFEPVTLLANEQDAKTARRACGTDVDILAVPVDDLWMRDTGPNFVLASSGIAGIDLNFNGWGGKQKHDRDGQVARKILRSERIARIQAPITGEGGGIEIDGQGTLLATESCWVNDNRNPGKSRGDIEDAMKSLYGVTTVIWVAGVKGHDITDYHIDALARFSEPGVVVMSTPPEDAPGDVWTKAYDQAHSVLTKARDARGKTLEIVELPEPADLRGHSQDFLASYVNYYVCNGGVIMPRFGDARADKDALSIVKDLYPGREVVQVPVDTLGEGGGGIHCSTQQLPKAL
ncbi:agmatine/peptidylarginine deiminase [Streptomyces sp. NPDC088785]|uniref:agmatine deiminase family protein n=1 Tax=Streptomyces sp. NPDC088785 TaxID=3365897 RepID=UPI0037F2179A